MSSKTASSKIYETSFKNYKIKIVDTPGFGDARGMNYDSKHRTNVVEIIKNLTYVNCIILVINGRVARKTPELEYVINDIASIMPKTIRNNIVVMFTNVDSIFNLNFKIESLSDHIRTDLKHYWYIENPMCKLEKVQTQSHRDLYKSNYIVEEDMLNDLQVAFKQTVERILNMYNTISNFTAIHSNDFLAVYYLKENIEKEYLRLLIQHDDLLKDIARLNQLKNKLEVEGDLKETLKNFNRTETYETTKLVDTPYHNTLCSHIGCNHNCHEDCGLPMTLELGSPVFKGCAAMDSTGLKCRICGHSYKDHHHVRAKYMRTNETRNYIDEKLLSKFNDAKNDEERTKIALEGLQKEIEKKKNELKTIFESIRKLVDEYEKLGLPESYLRLLRSRLAQTQLTIKTYKGDPDSDFYKALLKSRDDLRTKIHFEEKKMNTADRNEQNEEHDEI
jgi:GTP-binding protein EngB required for normal cell division